MLVRLLLRLCCFVLLLSSFEEVRLAVIYGTNNLYSCPQRMCVRLVVFTGEFSHSFLLFLQGPVEEQRYFFDDEWSQMGRGMDVLFTVSHL